MILAAIIEPGDPGSDDARITLRADQAFAQTGTHATGIVYGVVPDRPL